MPLDSKNLSNSTIMSFKMIPNTSERRDMTYQTKIDIYDRNCGKCGFKRILIKLGNPDRPGEHSETEIRSIEEAVQIAQKTGGEIIRSCAYPSDLTEDNDSTIYPTLNEIIMNTCRFWKSTCIEMKSDLDVFEEESDDNLPISERKDDKS